MTKEGSLQILDNCLKQLEAIPEDELFDYFYERSPSFRKAVEEFKVKGEINGQRIGRVNCESNRNN